MKTRRKKHKIRPNAFNSIHRQGLYYIFVAKNFDFFANTGFAREQKEVRPNVSFLQDFNNHSPDHAGCTNDSDFACSHIHNILKC